MDSVYPPQATHCAFTATQAPAKHFPLPPDPDSVHARPLAEKTLALHLEDTPSHTSAASHTACVATRHTRLALAAKGAHVEASQHASWALHRAPAASWHVLATQHASRPEQLALEPQSHCSPGSTTPLPHSAARGTAAAGASMHPPAAGYVLAVDKNVVRSLVLQELKRVGGEAGVTAAFMIQPDTGHAFPSLSWLMPSV